MSKIDPDPELVDPLPKLELAPELPLGVPLSKNGFGSFALVVLLLGGVLPPSTGAAAPVVAPDGVPLGVAGELGAGAGSLSWPKLTCAQHQPAMRKASRWRR
jgi:hypothetical protein